MGLQRVGHNWVTNTRTALGFRWYLLPVSSHGLSCVCVCVCSISSFYEDWIRPTVTSSCTSLKNLPPSTVTRGWRWELHHVGWGGEQGGTDSARHRGEHIRCRLRTWSAWMLGSGTTMGESHSRELGNRDSCLQNIGWTPNEDSQNHAGLTAPQTPRGGSQCEHYNVELAKELLRMSSTRA